MFNHQSSHDVHKTTLYGNALSFGYAGYSKLYHTHSLVNVVVHYDDTGKPLAADIIDSALQIGPQSLPSRIIDGHFQFIGLTATGLEFHTVPSLTKVEMEAADNAAESGVVVEFSHDEALRFIHRLNT